MVNIEGLNKAAVLAALYNASAPQGMGFLNYDPKPMTVEQAQGILEKEGTRFDYLGGRVMKVYLTSPLEFDERLYDRDNGPGAAQRAIDALRMTQDPDNELTRIDHEQRTTTAAENVRERVKQPTITESQDGITVVHMGLSDVADELTDAVKRHR